MEAEQEVDKRGAFVRSESGFRECVQAAKDAKFPAESGRYHLYVSYACPWACRTLAARKLKGLEDAIDVSVVDPLFRPTKPEVDSHKGWTFDKESYAGSTGDKVYGASSIRELYEKLAGEGVATKFTVPMLVDTKTDTIVNNESSEIIRMFNHEFDEFAKHPEVDLYPESLREAIDAVNAWVYPMLNNGVYRSGFAKSQEAYDEAVKEVFEALDRMEDILSKQHWLVGDGKVFTEADLRAFVTLVRFDPVYVTHFKCSKKTIREYPNLTNFMREIYQMPGIDSTVNMVHIREHYQLSHKSINPYGIVAVTADSTLDHAHDRDRF